MNRLAKLFQLKNRRQLRALARTWKWGMTSQREQRWLRNYAACSYRGIGAIVDLGCLLGATTISLAEGLALNRNAKHAKIHAYDLFTWDEGFDAWAKGWAEGKEVEGLFTVGGTFLPEFLRRTEKWRNYIVVHEQDLQHARWEHGPIEFLFIDAMKSPEVAGAIASRDFMPVHHDRAYANAQGAPPDFSASRLLQFCGGSSSVEFVSS